MNEVTTYWADSLLVTDNEIFGLKLYDIDMVEFEKGIAYLEGDYYYLYRGGRLVNADNLPLPGIYYDSEKKESYLIHPRTEDEKRKYTYEDKISSIDPNKIIETVNTQENILISIPESTRIFLPSIENNDDILKRCMKQALIEKGIDIDQYKHRFLDKNSLFNFKQVIRSKSKLSMLLFDRGCEALNLKYRIILEEADPNNIIGTPLKDKIYASSDDVFEI